MKLTKLNSEHKDPVKIELPLSKSISNRLLILQALSNNSLEIKNLSEAEDTLLLKKALASTDELIDIYMAGTAFRFLTAYYSLISQSVVLTGAERMKQRPVGQLVNALKSIGADIKYLETSGFPPLAIRGGQLNSNKVDIAGNISSQFITALMLIGHRIKGGLVINLLNEMVSKPYVMMTYELLKQMGVGVKVEKNKIVIAESELKPAIIEVERDWSSAAFFYQSVVLSKKKIVLTDLKFDSIQGDVACSSIFEKFGVKSSHTEEGILLEPIHLPQQDKLVIDLTDYPDLIPSVAVTAACCYDHTIITGVKTLRIKESDRVVALTTELAKVGVKVEDIDENQIIIHRSTAAAEVHPINFKSYNDHRIAMCLAPLGFLNFRLSFDDVKVVNKSFPNFWKEIRKMGLKLI